MKTINETFTDDEHRRLSRLKEKISWHDFIMLMFVHCLDSKKNGEFEVFNKLKKVEVK